MEEVFESEAVALVLVGVEASVDWERKVRGKG